MGTPSHEESRFYTKLHDIERILADTTNQAEVVVRILQLSIPEAQHIDSESGSGDAYKEHLKRIIQQYADKHGVKVPEYKESFFNRLSVHNKCPCHPRMRT